MAEEKAFPFRSSGAPVETVTWQYDEDYRRGLWYKEPLGADDVLAGGILLAIGLVFLPLYAAVAFVMFKNDKDIIGFRFLLSASLADMLLLFNYAIWPGITILAKSEIIAPYMRAWVQIYLDWAWFSMCYHYMVIAWSRFAAIRFANTFRVQPRAVSYSICGACYACALVQVLVTHFQPWYVTFYYEPSAYGMLAEDFGKYLNGGQSLFFFTFHLLMMIIPIFFYGCALALLIKHRKSGIFNGPRYGSKSANTETRLIIPCIFNSVVFIIGQVVITIGTGEGKWATWTVLLLFTANSAVNPVLLLCFSAIIRQKTLLLVIPLWFPSSSTYSNVLVARNSMSPIPILPSNQTAEDRRMMTSLVLRTEYHKHHHLYCADLLLRQSSEPNLCQDL